MRRLALSLAGVVALGSSAACADPVRDRIYPAPRQALSLQGLPAEARLERVRTADGLELTGVVVEGRADRPMILMLHGNGGSASSTTAWLRPVLDQGYGMVTAEYRGYSANPGQPSEDGLARDADAFLARARTLARERPVWIVGHSLGGGVAMALAERSRPDVLVTIGTFTRLRDMVEGVTRAIVPNAYRNLDRARTVSAPWFLVHGTLDDVVPASHGERLHAMAGEAGREGASLVIPGAGHGPEGETLARILEAIRLRQPGGPPSPDRLPTDVRVIPFGQSVPVAPAGG